MKSYFARVWVAVLIAGVGVATGSPAKASQYSGLYVFGDSLSDGGNLAALTNPAQVITNNTYIPNAPYASGQFTNGNVWVNGVANALGLAPYAAPALAGGGDFAFGGARVATDGPGLPPSLTSQVNLFLAGSLGHAPSGALYVVAGGGNDARDGLVAAAHSSDPSLVIASVAAAFATGIHTIVDELQSAGAKNLVVWNAPNLSLAPAITSQGAGAVLLASQLVAAMNAALTLELSNEHDVKIFDIFGLNSKIVADPSAYGFTNVTDACGAAINHCDPSTALYWDGIHPTAFAHNVIAEAFVATAVPEASTWALMLLGFAGVGFMAYRRRERVTVGTV